jgi:DNA mismatch repair protein MutS
VPAVEAEMPIFDRIFTRVGASDDLSRGQSTFMVEMSEAAEILRQATAKSLVILDEVGRGTSTTDGLAIAAAIMEDLSDRVCCFTMFATHYHELVPLMSSRKSVVPMQTEVVEKEDSIVFSHRLVTGASASSFGIEVAKLAGVPNHVIELAKARLRDPEVSAAVQPVMTREILGATVKDPGPNKGLSKVQKGLFGLSSDDESAATDKTMIADQTLSRLAMKLESIKIHKTTPLQALNILNDLKSMLAPVQQRALFDDDVLNP